MSCPSMVGDFLRKHGFVGFRRPMELLLVTITGLLVGTFWAATGLLVQTQGQIVPLHYTIYFGIDLTAQASRLYFLPAAATVIFFGHLIAARIIDHDAWRQSWLLLGLILIMLLGAVLGSLAYFQLNA